MADDPYQYDRLVENALRRVVRDSLILAAEHGFVGEHHFYITFRTDHPDVDIPPYLRAKYEQEMTIVLQYQFWGLEVGEEAFSVYLSFEGQREQLVVPFDAVTGFADPSARFGLQFRGADVEEEAGAAAAPSGDVPAEEAGGDEKVVTLDQFRKR